MTLKEIAKEVGISVSTASRILNRKPTNRIDAETRERVLEIARTGGYEPSTAAQALRMGTAEKGGRQILCLFARDANANESPLFAHISAGLEYTVRHRGASVQYIFGHYLDGDVAEEFKPDVSVDGVVVIGTLAPQTISCLSEKIHSNVIYVDTVDIPEVNCDFVFCNGQNFTREALKRLICMGHRKIAFLGNPAEESGRIYREVLGSYGLPNMWVRSSPACNYAQNISYFEAGYKGAQQLLAVSERPTAILCMLDLIAIGAIRAFQDAGLHVPADISVFTVSVGETRAYFSSGLTAVDVPAEELGRVAGSVLLDRISGGHSLPLRVQLPYSITDRGSCAVHVTKST